MYGRLSPSLSVSSIPTTAPTAVLRYYSPNIIDNDNPSIDIIYYTIIINDIIVIHHDYVKESAIFKQTRCNKRIKNY